MPRLIATTWYLPATYTPSTTAMIWPRMASFDGADGTKSAPMSAFAGNTLSPCMISRPVSSTRRCVSGSSRLIVEDRLLARHHGAGGLDHLAEAREMPDVAEQVAVVRVAQFVADVHDVVARAGRRVVEPACVHLVGGRADDVPVAHADDVRLVPDLVPRRAGPAGRRSPSAGRTGSRGSRRRGRTCALPATAAVAPADSSETRGLPST